MRIIIESHDTGQVSVRSDEQQLVQPKEMERQPQLQAAQEEAAIDAGAPSSELLMALTEGMEAGFMEEEAIAQKLSSEQDAGGPPSWLVDVIQGGGAPVH